MFKSYLPSIYCLFFQLIYCALCINLIVVLCVQLLCCVFDASHFLPQHSIASLCPCHLSPLFPLCHSSDFSPCVSVWVNPQAEDDRCLIGSPNRKRLQAGAAADEFDDVVEERGFLSVASFFHIDTNHGNGIENKEDKGSIFEVWLSWWIGQLHINKILIDLSAQVGKHRNKRTTCLSCWHLLPFGLPDWLNLNTVLHEAILQRDDLLP